MLKEKNYVPAFKQLKKALVDKIETVKPGTKIESIRTLREKFKVSQVTVDKALYELKNEGLIYNERGRGTFVAEKKVAEVKRKGIIALIIPQIAESPFIADIAQGVEDKVFELGYQMVLCSSYKSIKREKEYIRRILQNNTDGTVYVSSSAEPDKVLHLDEIASRMPLSVIDVALKSINSDYITTDDEAGAYEAVSHLINRGRKKIAILAVQKEISTILKRFKGYRKALEENGIPLEDNLIINSSWCSFKDGYDAVKKALDSGFEADALFCTTDRLASGALQALYERNIKIPEEFSVIGYGDQQFNNSYKLALSTVSQPALEMGKRAVELLNEKLEKKRSLFSYKEVVLPAKLKIKET